MMMIFILFALRQLLGIFIDLTVQLQIKYLIMASQQLRNTNTKPAQQNDNIKRYKKTAPTQQNQESLRKKGIKNQTQSNQNKITGYLLTTSQSKPNLNTRAAATLERSDTIEQLQEKVKEKDKLIVELREKREAETLRANNTIQESKKYKKNTRNIIARTMLELAEVRRAQRIKVNPNLGFFMDNMRTFMEGEALQSLRKYIAQKESMIKQLDNKKKVKSMQTQESIRIVSQIQHTYRELSEYKKQLENKEKQLAVYKDKLKLAYKEVNCQYYKQSWPIIYQNYQTLQLLGSGGFGEVYKCYDLECNRIVALKIMTLDHKSLKDLAYREDYFKHVKREAQIQKGLSHPNIAKLQKLIEINQQTSKAVLELQYCQGPQLSVYLRKHVCLEQKEAKYIIRQLFSALSYLSTLKERVIHYDLKPSNIMFGGGVVKIVDFGLCKVMQDSQDTKIQLTSQGVGTYWYLPPETFQQFDPSISNKVDVWSVGVIFFELLFGRKPFGHGIPQSQIYDNGIITKAKKVEFPTQNPKRYKVSDSAKEFIVACLTHNPKDRLSPTQAYDHPYLKK